MGGSLNTAAREQFMRLALEQARRGMAAGGPPVGACVVREDKVVAAAHNEVIAELDPTAHAEMQALRRACREERSLLLTGADLYVTLEPCAMCLTACHYTGIENIFFGAPIAALDVHTKNELCVSADLLYSGQSDAPQLHPALLEDECAALLDEWSQTIPQRFSKP